MKYLISLFFLLICFTSVAQTEIKEYVHSGSSRLFGGKMGLIDYSGNKFLDIVYDEIFSRGNNTASVKVSDTLSFRKEYSDIIIERVRFSSKFIIDLNGSDPNETIEKDRPETCPCSKKGENGKYGFVDDNEQFIIEPKYDWVNKFYHGFSKVRIGMLSGYVDRAGNEIELKYRSAQPFNDGLALVQVSGENHKRFIDVTGKSIVNDSTLLLNYSFSEGMAVAKRGKKSVIINTKGEIKETKFDDISGFSNGYAKVKIGNYEGLINKLGELVLPVKYRGLSSVRNNAVIFYEKGKYGLMSLDGKVLINPKYETLNFVGDHYLKARLGGHYTSGIVKETGALNALGQRVGYWEVEKQYHKDANKGQFTEGLKTGEWKVYIKDKLWRVENYKYGELDGLRYSYDDKGKLFRKEYFVDGFLQDKLPYEFELEEVSESLELEGN
ncbi:WG repeat-containing protein [Winogradskyella sp. PAMC22761]|nr:WG repeat-containing protein [Winogradskyella sp. PAMC22761]